MSRVISFRTDDGIAEVIDKEVDRAEEDTTRAEVTKRLVEEAAEARRTPLWLRVGLSDRRAAQLEDRRQMGETEEDLAAELLRESMDREGEDVLDAIGASGELREAVEDEREEGESLDGAVERLLRGGVDADTDPPSLFQRVAIGISLSGLGLSFVFAYATYGLGVVVVVAVSMVVYLAAYPFLDGVVGRVMATLRPTRG